MSDIVVEELDTAAEPAPSLKDTYSVPVTKAKNRTIDVQTSKLSDIDYINVIAAGLKHYVNAGMTTIKAQDYKSDEEYHAAAYAKAVERVRALLDGKAVWGRATAKAKSDIPAAVMNEARREARDIVKAAIIANGERITHYKPSEITKGANDLLSDEELGPPLIEAARKRIESRGRAVVPKGLKLNIHADPELVAKAEEKKAKKVDPAILSAAKAGQTVKQRSSKGTTTH